MKAAICEAFRAAPAAGSVPDLTPSDDGVGITVVDRM